MLNDYDDFASAIGSCIGAFTICKHGASPSKSMTVGIIPSTVGSALSFLPKGVPNIALPDGRLVERSSFTSSTPSILDENARCLVIVVSDWDSLIGGTVLSFEHLAAVRVPLAVRRPSPPLSGRAVSPGSSTTSTWQSQLNHLFFGVSPSTCTVHLEAGRIEVRLRCTLHAFGSEFFGADHLYTFTVCVSPLVSQHDKNVFNQFVGTFMASSSFVQRQAAERDRREIGVLTDALANSKLREGVLHSDSNDEGPLRSRGARVEPENAQVANGGMAGAVRPRVAALPRGRGRGVRIGT